MKISRKASDDVKIAQAKERLLSRRIIMSSGCWYWAGGILPAGYGQTSFKGEYWLVHRLSMYLFKPDEFKFSLNVLHTCNHERCFNPAHLYCGGQSQNVKDAVNSGNHQEANKTHCPRGHEYSPENTALQNGKRKCRACIKINNAMRYLVPKA